MALFVARDGERFNPYRTALTDGGVYARTPTGKGQYGFEVNR